MKTVAEIEARLKELFELEIKSIPQGVSVESEIKSLYTALPYARRVEELEAQKPAKKPMPEPRIGMDVVMMVPQNFFVVKIHGDGKVTLEDVDNNSLWVHEWTDCETR